jgi:hypothetical protein
LDYKLQYQFQVSIKLQRTDTDLNLFCSLFDKQALLNRVMNIYALKGSEFHNYLSNRDAGWSQVEKASRQYGHEREFLYHILCPALVRHRIEIFSSAWLEPIDIRRAPIRMILALALWSGLPEGL